VKNVISMLRYAIDSVNDIVHHRGNSTWNCWYLSTSNMFKRFTFCL